MESSPSPSPNSGASGSTCSGVHSRFTTSAISRAISSSNSAGSTTSGCTLAIQLSLLEHRDLGADRFVQVADPPVVVAVDGPLRRVEIQVGAGPVGDVVGLDVVGDVDHGLMAAQVEHAFDAARAHRRHLPAERQAGP